jgi:hypothetical protein
MIKILAIGNSFSQDATAYLHDLAEQGGIPTKVVNLFIGGCSLERHWQNASGDLPEYEYELNGMSGSSGKKVSIKEALLEETWDFITLQQASGYSGVIDSYYPYIKDLHEYVRNYAPESRQLIHETWAYEIDSSHPHFELYGHSQVKMYEALKKAYQEAASDLGLELIPSGDLIQALRGTEPFNYAKGGPSLCRDGFHLNLTYGRYAAAALWYAVILKGGIDRSNFLPPPGEGGIDMSLIQLIKDTVKRKIDKLN